MCNFVEDQSEETLEVVEASPVCNMGLFLRIKKDLKVPTCQLGQAEANVEEESEGGEDEEEEEAVVIPEPCKAKRTTSKPDRKGGVLSSSERKPKKKKAMPKFDKVPRSKRKLLAESTLAVKKAKVHFWIDFML